MAYVGRRLGLAFVSAVATRSIIFSMFMLLLLMLRLLVVVVVLWLALAFVVHLAVVVGTARRLQELLLGRVVEHNWHSRNLEHCVVRHAFRSSW